MNPMAMQQVVGSVPRQAQIPDLAELADQREDAGIRHQEITYNRQDGPVYVGQQPTDLLKAASETKSLGWKNYNFITFYNHRTRKTIQFIRKGEDHWYAEDLIGQDWNGYVWMAYTDSRHVLDVIRLFFEEGGWQDVLDWKMAGVRGHYER